ncbi:hypothetical protein [Moorena sp. SIO3I6]|uniref:hypothetical protein n=1 Tax=Moorena sp. SIO3I6 TaxID=2607831 RepID=UPI0013FA1247|nr:hypothetical protein [Moorena sp. SIO3I6]NEP22599.1 hypothetical protein [Moorena sp. SIO3I6]
MALANGYGKVKVGCQPSTFNLQPWPFGHATRTTFNLGLSATLREQLSPLAFRPRYANNLQPSTLAFRPRYANNLQVEF